MERHILGYRCQKCKSIFYPNRWRCRKCGNDTFETEPLPKDGKLLTFSRVHNLPPDFEVVHLTLGIVELTNGVRITGQLRIDQPKIGMKVKGAIDVVRVEGYQRHWGMVFTAA